jgi:hypothetical protein
MLNKKISHQWLEDHAHVLPVLKGAQQADAVLAVVRVLVSQQPQDALLQGSSLTHGLVAADDLHGPEKRCMINEIWLSMNQQSIPDFNMWADVNNHAPLWLLRGALRQAQVAQGPLQAPANTRRTPNSNVKAKKSQSSNLKKIAHLYGYFWVLCAGCQWPGSYARQQLPGGAADLPSQVTCTQHGAEHALALAGKHLVARI